MRRLMGCGLTILMLIGAFLFVRQWRSTTPWAVGTGDIQGKSKDLPARDARGVGTKTKSTLAQIASDPTRFEGRRMTVTGRVRGAGKYASNRNIYTLAEGDYRILVVDDKKPPREYWTRTVSGEVKVFGPKVGGLNRAYLVDVKQGIKINPPQWSEVSHFFTEKYQRVKAGVDEELTNR
ncbi:MAG: hypothetical protein JWN98_411 [Abditibacteriota bacterium]|nr:hypothetical protein [Abditibacteriota bacterium]